MHFADYAIYEADLRDFFQREEITHLSTSAPPSCVECTAKWDDAGEVCTNCGAKSEDQREPWFSWSECDCCRYPGGGNRYHAVGFDIKKPGRKNQWYIICEDCSDYVEHGCLSDKSMEEVESTREAAKEYETDSGLFIQPPDESGTIRVEDEHGNTVDTYPSGSGEWREWIVVFTDGYESPN